MHVSNLYFLLSCNCEYRNLDQVRLQLKLYETMISQHLFAATGTGDRKAIQQGNAISILGIIHLRNHDLYHNYLNC